MPNSLIIIIIVLLFSGIFGGLVNFFMSEEKTKKTFNVLQSIFIGLCASFTVPLFLNMISSNLLEQIRGSESIPGDPLKIFVLAGFCLVAATYSRKFMQTISDSILKEIKESKETAKHAEKEVLNVKEDVELILEKGTEAEQSDKIKDIEDILITELSEDQRKVLRAMAEGKLILRSISGLAKDTGLQRDSVNKEINELISKGFVTQRESEKGPRWFITSEGRKSISNF